MKSFLPLIACFLFLSGGISLVPPVVSAQETHVGVHARDWSPIPNERGVAGPFAGKIGETLVVAGGANFPDKMPWEGGAKVWHDSVEAYDPSTGQWQSIGSLPRPLGYGVSVSLDHALVGIGGSDSMRHYADCWMLTLRDGHACFTPLPPLPSPIANACGTCLGRTLYVAGGLASPDDTEALRVFWKLDLDMPQAAWRSIESWPGPARMLSVAATTDDAFFLVGGVSLHPGPDGKASRTYLRDVYRYRPTEGWMRVADLPYPVAAAPSPAATHNDHHQFTLLGGDSGKDAGFQPPEKHPGFLTTLATYDAKRDHWTISPGMPLALVTTTLVPWNNGWILPSGELRPGVRSPRVLYLELTPTDP